MSYRKAALSELDIMKVSMLMMETGKPLDSLDLSEYGDNAEELKSAVRGKIARLIGVPQTVLSEAPSNAEVAIPALVPTAPESLESVLKNLEAQYPQMVATLRAYEISLEGILVWEDVKAGLTPEILTKALKLEKPTLLLVPPMTRQALVAAIDKYPISRQTQKTYTYQLENNDLWSNDKPEITKDWQILIVEGVQEVGKDPKITRANTRNNTMTKEYIEKYAAYGLDVINDARTYLTLMMISLQAGEPIDQQTWTVLNGKTRKEDALLSFGGWDYVQVRLNFGFPGDSCDNLRLRGAVRVM